jgi:two pore calcium channel protein 1
LLAVVCEAFEAIEKDKFRKLLLHKREAVKRAFGILKDPSEGIPFRRFAGLMRYFRPKHSMLSFHEA